MPEPTNPQPGEPASQPPSAATIANDSNTLPNSNTPLGSPFQSQPPPHIPDHELLSRIARGSYGEVWLARNVMGTFRAVKIVHRAAFDHARPFDREFNGIKKFEPISRSHSGLVDILQIGRGEDFFYSVMELADDAVTGQQIDPDHYEPKTLRNEMRQRGRLSFERCVELGLALAAGLSHMHKHGLIHRDIKPSNIIFVHGQAKLADIGLVAEQGDAKSFVGTEGFIPPEGPGSPQADLYSLGKVLYEIVTGKDRHEFPELPTMVDERETESGLVELNSVFLKACQNDVKLRYQTADEMRDDLLLLQSGKSVKRVQKVERRLALLTKLSLVGITMTLLVLAGFYWAKRRANQAEAQARLEAKLRERADAAEKEARQNLYAADMNLAQQALGENNRGRALNLLTRHRPKAGEPDSRGWEWRYLWKQCQSDEIANIGQQPDPVQSVAFSPDGKLLAIGAQGKNPIKLWDLNLRRMAGSIPQTSLGHVAFSPDGKLIAAARTPGVRLWDRDRLVELHALASPDGAWPWTMAFSPDGSALAIGYANGAVAIWDIANGKPTRRAVWPGLNEHVSHLSWSADGRLLVASAVSGCRVWTTVEGTLAKEFGSDWVEACFSPRDALLVAADGEGAISFWDTRTWQMLDQKRGHEVRVFQLAFSRDGKQLATAGGDQMIKIWDAQSREPTSVLKGHLDEVFSVAFSPDGQTLASGGKDDTVRLWSTSFRKGSELHFSWPQDGLMGRFAPDAQMFLVVRKDGTAEVRTTRTLQLETSFKLETTGLSDAGLSHHGELVALGFTTGLVKIFSTEKQVEIGQFKADSNSVTQLRFSHDGKMLSTISENNDLRLWRLPGGGQISSRGMVLCAEFSPDDKMLLVGMDGGETNYVLNTTDLEVKILLRGHRGRVVSGAFSSDGKLVATASWDGTARVWDATTGKVVGIFRSWLMSPSGLGFSPDGRRLAVSAEKKIKLWALDSQQEVMTLASGGAWTCFFLDADTLVSVTGDAVSLWQAAPLAEPE